MKDINPLQVSQFAKHLPVMPLPMVILPGGIQRLKIFEPKYISMIKKAIKGDGFVVCLQKKHSPYSCSNWGGRVKIIDFNLAEGNILLIDIQALNLVKLGEVERDIGGLLSATFTPLSHWGFREISSETRELAESLQDIFQSHISLRDLYKKTYFHDANWVCARFIEILPLSLNKKEKFIFDYSFDQIEGFLHTLIQGKVKNS
ncbi:LON peptidase substrate-binding domain-containing protein [Shewanella sp. UCD-KL12]|uniref:LON peptidase substrate-binding domain-containing protein n=1 Tax=Shewanella sp. UCD-KL12 TaxID=1917163 RepID=UPI0009FA6DEE|nr:LON peptidase substrate-binding domain-containing protein [Shewanella sp. UCD-KL12]